MQVLLDFAGQLAHLAVVWYGVFTASPYWPVAKWSGGVLVAFIAAFRAWLALRQYLLRKRDALAVSLQDEEFRLKWFQGQDFVAATEDYLVPFCSNVDPSDRDDLRNTVAVREPVFDAVDRELDAEDKRHILILGDSGMGKTTLLLNLIAREGQRRKAARRRLALIPLGEAGALDGINAIPSKRETILLLDAFDEDPRAIEDAAGRMEAIMSAAAPFKKVVMTCRTQFFPSEVEIPRQTGIKRVSARRAGTSVVYQWLTVYIQPFDRSQIDRYLRKAIPWRRFEQRKKARAIVSDVSDLAARPMLTALIPQLAAAKREAHSLWDLYAFMVDTWMERESSWIDASALRRISKKIAVDLVLKRGVRGSERMSREELIQISEVQDVPLDTWKLTSRSLLNRDADGLFKFAHRSILEFFFIQSLIEGELRCLPVKWTDMMCDLFLSWGSSTNADDKLALRLLASDFRATGLFPVVERHQPSARIDASWAKQVLSDRAGSAARAKFPHSWRSAVAHVVSRGSILRAYDIADGLVWQLVDTHQIDNREERWVHQCDRYSLTGVDQDGREWEVVDLYELELLCEILAKRKMLGSAIDERELYWLADTDGSYSTLTRIRSSGSAELVEYPDLELLHSGKSSASRPFTIDVYRVATKGVAIGHIRAMAIVAHHGDAAAMHIDDAADVKISSWSVNTERKLPVQRWRTP